jgi:FMN reductase
MAAAALRVVTLNGSPGASRRTEAVLASVRGVVGELGAMVSAVGLDDHAAAGAAVQASDAVVFGSPVYRASYAAPLKAFLDALPRGMWGETSAPLRGKAVAIVLTGASDHHFLAVDDLRNVLAGFFAAHVVPPGLYVPSAGFTEDLALRPDVAEHARHQATALLELAAALRDAPALRSLEPLA